MATTFANAPLVELIAELRWNDGTVVPFAQGVNPAGVGNGGPGIRIQFGGPDNEAFFMRFGGELYKNGFQASERLVPPNFPIVGGQPVYRFKASNETGVSPVLYQIGAGMFSVNAVPPYKTWAEFRPNVEQGIRSLLAARASDQQAEPFSTLSLRYIDAFRPPLTRDLEVGAFIEKVLGIDIKLPDALTKKLAEGQHIKPLLQLNIPMDGLMMAFTVAEGAVNGEPAILMDTTVSSNTPIVADYNEVMGVFQRAHEVIHDVFMSLTRSLFDDMGPVGG
ncbi:TIGR04255 family protein [Cupriavidus basilensis]|uniref:TIGR04255 family protein n=1 Tax=Cupriavidus basilensis TaxID=68895 RepID=UPI00157B7ECC|nr:TIGR04255 family protein [Cupriavidus basilensis]NUA26141.1 TIGR04255 family protein [Cupriavidus basilensis]